MTDIPHEYAAKLLHLSPQPALLLDSAGRIHGCNPAFRELVGNLVIDGSTQPDTGLLQPLLGTGTVINWAMPDGEQRWLVVEVIDLPEADGMQARYYRDITEALRLRHERDALQEELHRQSMYDIEIPSLLNRNGLLLTVAPLVARARRYNTPLSVLLLSVADGKDHDRDMRTVASILRDQTRWADLLGLSERRDFVLVLQETSGDTAQRLVEKLSACFTQHSGTTGEPLEVRYGIAECGRSDDAESLFERAAADLAAAPDTMRDSSAATPGN